MGDETRLGCKHTFHPGCLDLATEKEPGCPNCRARDTRTMRKAGEAGAVRRETPKSAKKVV